LTIFAYDTHTHTFWWCELRASCLWGRHSTAWAMLPVLHVTLLSTYKNNIYWKKLTYITTFSGIAGYTIKITKLNNCSICQQQPSQKTEKSYNLK
jgi:hypothetical protein